LADQFAQMGMGMNQNTGQKPVSLKLSMFG
jgi:hypothetical protein